MIRNAIQILIQPQHIKSIITVFFEECKLLFLICKLEKNVMRLLSIVWSKITS